MSINQIMVALNGGNIEGEGGSCQRVRLGLTLGQSYSLLFPFTLQPLGGEG